MDKFPEDILSPGRKAEAERLIAEVREACSGILVTEDEIREIAKDIRLERHGLKRTSK